MKKKKRLKQCREMEDRVTSLLSWLGNSSQFRLSNKVRINETEEAGRGVVLALDKLETNEIIISVPGTHQLNFYTVLRHIALFNTSLTISGITIAAGDIEESNVDPEDPRLKAYSVLDSDLLLGLSSFQLLTIYILAEWILLPRWSRETLVSYWKPFFDVWPSKEEFRSIPTIWNLSSTSKYKALLHLLPSASKAHYLRISSLVEGDWNTISPILERWDEMFSDSPSIQELYESFLHVYFIINSRCLYAEIELKEDDAASNFTMVPYVDFINHTDQLDEHCYPTQTPSLRNKWDLGQFEMRCGKKRYNIQGEEIYLNYGPHSNEFLLNEYGFTLNRNCWNSVDLTKELTDMMEGHDEVKSFLKSYGYWGDYSISLEEISYRTLVAISLIVTLDFTRVEKLLLGYISEEYFLPKIKSSLQDILVRLLKNYRRQTLVLKNEEDTEQSDICIKNVANIYSDYISIIKKTLDNL